MDAIVLIAHGSRRAEANADLEFFAEQLRSRRLAALVQTAYLEFAAPDIPTALELCLNAGATRITMLPFFLSPGVHVRQDLDDYRSTFAANHPTVHFDLAQPLGQHPLLVDILEQRAREAERASRRISSP